MAIYDIVVPKDYMLRQINELVDFSFILDTAQSADLLGMGIQGATTIFAVNLKRIY